MPWRPPSPRGNVTALVLGDPAADRLERAEALRRSLPQPRDDERGDTPEPAEGLAAAVREGAVAVAAFYGVQVSG